MPLCPKCGEENAERARFCMACGVRLAVATGRERRKLATMLFCDVTGSTAMGERFDAEAVRALMLRYFEEMRAAIEGHGGAVEKFIGDAVVGVFGVPVAHEDDALRAVRAAAEMQERASRLNEEFERRFGLGIALRIGVNTGEVVTGEVSADRPMASGDPVNVAARLEQAAQPGDILVGEHTYLLTRDAVSLEPVEPLALKGKTEQVAAYRVRSVAAGGPEYVRRIDAELVDREAELEALEGAFASCLAERRCPLVAIVGEAGVGKSRLAAEFVRSATSGSTVLSGRCLSYGEGITYWPLAEAVRQAAGVDAADTPARARARIAELTRAAPHGETVAGLVAVAAGLSEASASPEEIAWAARRLLAALARERPVIFLLDDLQWAEPTFLALVDALAGMEAPVVLLALARPELLERPELKRRDETVVIRLEPLPADASAALVETTLGGGLSRDLRDYVIEAAGGNPLFLEELLAMLIDSGLLRRSDGGWVAAPDESAFPLPPTLEALLEGRLDLLDEEEREVLERGSVEGKIFRLETVEALSAPNELEGLPAALDALADKGLVHPTVLAGEPAFLFRHLLIRDVVYRGIPKKLRAELHERFAGWLVEKSGERAPELAEVIGYHLEQACSYRRELGPLDHEGEAVAQSAAARLEEAGFRALARGDVFAAINLLQRAVALLRDDDPARMRLLPELGAALAEAGSLSEAAGVLAEARRLAEAVGDERLEAHAHVEELVLGLQVDAGSAMAEAQHAGVRARRTFEEAGDDLGLCRLSYLQGQVHWLRGRAAAAEEAWERAASHARRAGDQRRLADILRWIPSAVLFGPTPAPEGIRRCEEIRQLLRGNLRAQSEILPALGGLHAMTGRFESARELLAESDAILEELGFTIHSAPEWAAFVALLEGDPATAEERLQAGYERLAAMGETQLLSTTAALLARAIYEQGRYDEAHAFTEASAEAAAVEDVVTQIAWRAARARILVGQGHLDEGERLAREAVALAEGTDLPSDRADALLDLAEVLRTSARPEEAGTAVRRALSLYERKGNLVGADKARSLLAELALV
ncbi:MAG: ATP-binding protein [Gaiellaceae bacterium]